MSAPSCVLNHVGLMNNLSQQQSTLRVMCQKPYVMAACLMNKGHGRSGPRKRSCYCTHHSETGAQRGIWRGEQRVAAGSGRGCFGERPFHSRWFGTVSFLLDTEEVQSELMHHIYVGEETHKGIMFRIFHPSLFRAALHHNLSPKTQLIQLKMAYLAL